MSGASRCDSNLSVGLVAYCSVMADDPINADELITLGRELIEAVEERDHPLTARTDRMVNLAHVPLVAGLAHHTLRLGAIVFDLYEQNLRLEAMPLVRSVYETAITAAWLSQSREAVGAFANEDVRQRKALSGSMAKAASDVFREGADQVAHITDSEIETIAQPQARSLEHRCRALAPAGDHAYAIYRAMSALVHPSSTLADHYLTAADNDAGLELHTYPEQPDHNSWLYLTVASMMWAMRALDHMDADHPHRSHLRAMARRLGTSPTLRLTDAAADEERRAEQSRRRAARNGPRRSARDA